EDEPPQQAGRLDDARVAEELPQVRPQRPGGGGVGGAQLDQENAGAVHAAHCSRAAGGGYGTKRASPRAAARGLAWVFAGPPGVLPSSCTPGPPWRPASR